MNRLALYLHAISTLCLVVAGATLAHKNYLHLASICYCGATLLPMWVADRLTARWKK